METGEIGRMPIITLAIYFLIYIAVHVFIGLLRDKALDELDDKPGNIEIEKKVKWTNIAFKIFPMVYVVFLVLVLYFG